MESVLPFLEKKNIPGQEDRPEEEEPRGILKLGNRSKGGNSKPKRVHFWDESPPILKVLRVQDHHGHVTQEHSAGKVEPFPKTIQGSGKGKRWDLDFSRSKRKDHRAAEVVPRSGSTEPRDLVVILVWEVFRWLMGHLTLLVAPLFNRQMVEQAELMVKLALKDQEKMYVGKKNIPQRR